MVGSVALSAESSLMSSLAAAEMSKNTSMGGGSPSEVSGKDATFLAWQGTSEPAATIRIGEPGASYKPARGRSLEASQRSTPGSSDAPCTARFASVGTGRESRPPWLALPQHRPTTPPTIAPMMFYIGDGTANLGCRVAPDVNAFPRKKGLLGTGAAESPQSSVPQDEVGMKSNESITASPGQLGEAGLDMAEALKQILSDEAFIQSVCVTRSVVPRGLQTEESSVAPRGPRMLNEQVNDNNFSAVAKDT
jgi:hypothetical protein